MELLVSKTVVRARQVEEIPVAIIGAGWSGLTLSAHLQTLGIKHVVLEAGRLGETWRRIPGS